MGESGLPVRGAGTVRPRPNTVTMTEQARRERTERLLASRLEEWIDEQRVRAARGEFLFSVNDYAVLLRRPGEAPPAG